MSFEGVAVPAGVVRRKAGSTEMNRAWADLPAAEIEALIDHSRAVGWREALRSVGQRAPFFHKRMADLGLLDWHTLLATDPEATVLDVGCGFGSGVLGLADTYRHAVGLEFLPDRVKYAALRAHEGVDSACSVTRGSGQSLPFQADGFSLVTLNGVLEWAALYAPHLEPRAAQRQMLAEIRRVLDEDGTLAVAIENRFAAESLLALKDTHTGLFFVTAMPRWLASRYSRWLKGEDYRSYLYGHEGYLRLFKEAGYSQVRLLDLVSSYNDYDFAVRPDDTLTYRLLYRNDWIRPFYPSAATLRRMLARLWPSRLGRCNYAYLVVAGNDATTLLDADHPVWELAASVGVGPDRARFACKSDVVGAMSLLSHDGHALTGRVEILPLSSKRRLSLPKQLEPPRFRTVLDTELEGRRVVVSQIADREPV